MKYKLEVYEEIEDERIQIENPTPDDIIKALNKAGMVHIRIYDDYGKLVYKQYHEKLG